MINRSVASKRQLAVRFGVALTAMAALAVVMASSALATATLTKSSRWYVAGKGLNAGDTREAKCGLEGSGLVFTEIASGNHLTWQASGVECFGPSSGLVPTGKPIIKQQTGSTAVWMGRLRFTGLKFISPSACKITRPGAVWEPITELTTEPLVAQIYKEGENPEGEKLFQRFSSEGEWWTSFGIDCGIFTASNLKLFGATFGQLPSKFGSKELASQTLTFDNNAEGIAGSTLKTQQGAVYLSGQLSQTLTSGSIWGLRES